MDPAERKHTAMKISNETKVGIITTVSLGLLFIGYNYLRGNDVFSTEKEYYTDYNNVDGLSVSKPVVVNGYPIGRVARMQLLPNGKIRTHFKVRSEYAIPSNTVARIVSADLLGSKVIVFELGDSDSIAGNGDPILSDVQANLLEKVEPLQKKVENLAVKLDSVLSAVNTALGGEFQQHFSSSLRSISISLRNMEHLTRDVGELVGSEKVRLAQIMQNIESITENFKNNGDKISAILANIEDFSDGLSETDIKATVDNANRAMLDVQAITAKIDRGEGSIGLLLNDPKLYDNLNSASQGLDSLIKDLKERPGRYVRLSIFGKKDTK